MNRAMKPTLVLVGRTRLLVFWIGGGSESLCSDRFPRSVVIFLRTRAVSPLTIGDEWVR